MKLTIIEVDRDYGAWSGTEVKEFKTYEEAEEYCKEKDWTGYEYYVDKKSLPKDHPRHIQTWDNGYW